MSFSCVISASISLLFTISLFFRNESDFLMYSSYHGIGELLLRSIVNAYFLAEMSCYICSVVGIKD